MKERLEYFKFGKEWVWSYVTKNGSCRLADMLRASGLIEDEEDMREWETAQKTMMRYVVDAEEDGLIVTTRDYNGALRLMPTEQGRRLWQA